MTPALVVALVSVACQAASALLALIQARRGRRTAGWLLLAAAFLMMAVRRLLTLQELTASADPRLTPFDLLGVGLSVVLLAGLLSVGGFFDELERTRATLTASEERYRSLLRQSSEGIYLFDPVSLRALEANITFLALSGYTEAEFAGLRVTDLVAHDPEEVRRNAARVLEEGSVRVGERRYRRRDGSLFDVEVSACPVNAGGSMVVLVNVRDLTGKRRAEGAVRLSQELDRRIARHEPLPRLLAFLCEEIVVRLGHSGAWIASREQGGTIGRLAASSSLAGAERHAACRWDGAGEGGCPVAAALRSGTAGIGGAGRGPACGGGGAGAPAVHLPLGLEGAAELVLVAEGGPADAFDGSALELLDGLARQAAFAVLDARRTERVDVQTAALEALAAALVITDRNGRIEWVNPAFTTLTGFEPAEALGKTPRILSSGSHPPYFFERLWATILSGEVWRGELFNRRKDGAVYVEEQTITPVRGADGSIGHFVSVKQDVTSRKRYEERVRYLAEHDPLTDLPSRRAVESVLERLVSRARRGTPSSLLLLDLDNFKVVNDAAGHLAGDGVLVELARLVRGELRPEDTLGRLGGDVFVVLLDGTGVEEARPVAERLRGRIEEHRFHAGPQAFDLGLSVCIAPVDGSTEPAALLGHADGALHSAKTRGRGLVLVVEPGSGRDEATQASVWAVRVKDALREGRLHLALQPIVRLGTGRPVHHEVLLRLFSEEEGMIGPARFLPAAERFGLMPRVDRWVIDGALRLLAEDPGLELFVNVSGSSLGQAAFLDEVEERLREAAVPPGRLTFEITETAVVSDFGAAIEWMRRLKGLGCRFALDDFGSGFSSYTYLQNLPADYVKIDGAFTRALAENPTNRAIIRAIVTVAHTLGKETIAEAVETREAASILRGLGVEYGQGWSLGRERLAAPRGGLAAVSPEEG